MAAGQNIARVAASTSATGATRDPVHARSSAVPMSRLELVLGCLGWFSDNFLAGGALPVDEDSASLLVLLLDFDHLFTKPGIRKKITARKCWNSRLSSALERISTNERAGRNLIRA